jgi:hypothetical protein
MYILREKENRSRIFRFSHFFPAPSIWSENNNTVILARVKKIPYPGVFALRGPELHFLLDLVEEVHPIEF